MRVLVVASAIASAVLTACSGSDAPPSTPTVPTATATPPASSPTVPPPPGAATPAPNTALIEAARDALARWLGPVGNRPSITVASVESVTWSNGCLDLNRIGRACTAALVDGFRIRLGLANATYELRTNASGSVILWSPEVQVLTRFIETSPNFVHLRTDDGGRIDAQTVPGSDFGSNPAALPAMSQVGVGLARAPQSGGWLLVWLDPVP